MKHENLNRPHLLLDVFPMDYVQGELLTPRGFEKGYLGIEDGKILDRGTTLPPKKPLAKGFILPSFVNAHTHLGDSFVKQRNIDLPHDIEKLVGPPDGLKHTLLRKTSSKEIIAGMKQAIQTMTDSGIRCFWDFRENGLTGLQHLKEAMQDSRITSVVFSRPTSLSYDKTEVDALLVNSDGIGLSSVSDWNYGELQKIVHAIRKKGKLLGLHASERTREDIDKVLDLKPDVLIHMIHATQDDLLRTAAENIPVVVCPTANAFFGLQPDVDLMKECGIQVLIGTDNAMISTLNVVDELKLIKKMSTAFSTEDLLRMITYHPRETLGIPYTSLDIGSPADIVVLEKKSLNLVFVSPSQVMEGN